jgi:type IV pilus assembly protein PilW
MYWPRQSIRGAAPLPTRRPRVPHGFTLVELMVGLAIGLLASLAVMQVMVASEGQKRTTTSGSDAQVDGALALNTLQRAIQPAGYGFSAVQPALGCTVTAVFNGTPIANTLPNFPTTLAPVVITQGTGNGPDSIQVLASGKSSYSVPLRVSAPGYDPNNAALKFKFPVSTVQGVAGPSPAAGTPITPGDLMIAVVDSSSPCEMFQVTQTPSTTSTVDRLDSAAGWNQAGFPDRAYLDGSFLLNMGEMVHNTYVVGSQSLRVTSLQIAADGTPSYSPSTELFSNIVNMKAMYGKDTNGDGAIDTWDNTTPGTPAQWLQVLAVRVAVVARSAQYEKEEVTSTNPQWDVGTAIAITGTVTCGTSKCLDLHVDSLADWKHYRYKVFDTVIPLRNMLWNS